jgi:hypothetical protein
MLSRWLLLLAAGILVFVGGMHSYLGERLLFPRLFALPDLPLFRKDRGFTEAVLRFAWHLTSLAWWGMAVVVGAMALTVVDNHRVGVILGATVLLSGLIIVVTCGVRHPAWWLFLIAGACILYGTR